MKIEGVDDVFETATRASMLMRDGVETNGAAQRESGELGHHRRKSSVSGVPEGEVGKGCCVVC